MRRDLLVLAGCLLAWLHVALAAAVTMPAAEVARTPEGKFTIFQRGPATEADLQMPIFSPGTLQTSVVYRVQDRKARSLLFFARVHLVTAQPADAVKQYYLTALAADVTQDTHPETGVITLASGEKDHCRLVTITPTGGGCRLRLERVQQFTVPPHVYTADEQRILQLLDAVATRYRTARRVTYTMEQKSIVPDDATTTPPVLSWRVNFSRPAAIHVTAGTGDVIGLEITTVDDSLRVRRQLGEDERREFAAAITLDDLPELEDDPVAGLMLGASLTPLLDSLRTQPVAGVPADQQTEVILRYPDLDKTVYLVIDLKHQRILRSKTVIVGDHETVTTVRTYTTTVLSPAGAQTGTPVQTPQPTPPPR